MNKSNKVSLLLILTLFTLSCNKQNDLELIKSSFESANIDLENWSNKAVIILPNSGCSGCISSTEQFIVDNKDKFEGRLFFVFTRIQSKKATLARMNLHNYQDENMYFDIDNFFRSEALGNYPFVAIIRDGEIEYSDQVSPDNIESLTYFQSMLNEME